VESKFIDQLTNLGPYKSANYGQALIDSFKLMDELIVSEPGTKELNEKRGSSHEQVSSHTGCTANVVLMTPKKYYIANAGDSRSVLCRAGQAIQLSEDHKPENAEEEQRIRKAGGTISMGRVNGGLNLTRSFGDFDYKQNTNLPWHEQMITAKPDIKEVERDVEKDEFIIVGCDGIWEKYVDNSQGLIDVIK
jgi:serine/threonine protein phosphatase PrpC